MPLASEDYCHHGIVVPKEVGWGRAAGVEIGGVAGKHIERVFLYWDLEARQDLLEAIVEVEFSECVREGTDAVVEVLLSVMVLVVVTTHDSCQTRRDSLLDSDW